MLIPIYLSHATPHKKEQEYLKESLTKLLEKYDFDVQTIKASDIRTNDSIGAIKKRMKTCYGLIALAYGRRSIISSINKYNADLSGSQSKKESERLETTPYIQIESSIASAYELPILMLKENNLIEEGVLEPFCLGISGPNFTFDNEKSGGSKEAIDKYLQSKDLMMALKEFKKDVSENYNLKHRFL
ncbi:MAG: hypothetical protein IJL87_06195 [Clostridia bacterium]|nr:hypothetical protein [Clostridia bacterium]